MQPNSDSDLLNAVRQNDESALSELYDRHAPAIMGVAMKILRNREESEDLVHDVFVEAWQRAHTYNEQRGSVRTWLMVRTRSRAIDRLRMLATARRHANEEVSSSPEPEATSRDDPSLATDHRRARASLLELPDPQREVLELAYFAGLSCTEIARRIDCPVGTVKSRMAAGLSRLRVAFSAEGML